MILILDNYDSFTYNLYQIAGTFRQDIKVIRNDELTVDEIAALAPSHIIISPGPGRPRDAGVCESVIQYYHPQYPSDGYTAYDRPQSTSAGYTAYDRPQSSSPPRILGICLGHQVICEALGAEITYAKKLMHGKKTLLHIANGSPLFRGLPPLLEAGLYHSLAVKRETLPDELLVIAETDNGEVMGVKHRHGELYGLQFHPESILTPEGARIIKNFLHSPSRQIINQE